MNVHKLKFGTILSVEGLINHTVEEKEVQTDSGWGESPAKNAIEGVRKELEITMSKPPSKKDVAFYSKEDFVKKVDNDEDNPFADDESEDDSGDDWGGSASSSNDDDPFNDDFGF